MTSRNVRRVVVAAALIAFGACKDGSGPPEVGPPAQIIKVTTTTPTALANTTITTPIQLSVRDANGHAVPNAIVSFQVIAGGGVLDAPSDTSDANGMVEVPAWTLGKGAEAQTVRATVNSTVTLDVNATVQTLYKIEVRFFGTTMTAEQKELFTRAAARLSGIVVGDVIDADARGQNFDLGTQCNVSGQPPFNELVDDIIIYASIRDIDGPNNILAQAGPCLYRNAGTDAAPQWMPAIGSMQFDSADINTLTGAGSLQEVITHEMLHVLGVGVLWEDRGYVTGSGTSDPQYTGEQARLGCVAVGGTVTCATSVPLANQGGAGTVESHWREQTFDSELMTGFIDASPNPLSKITIGSLADLGYQVNNADFDPYTIPGGLLRSSPTIAGPAHHEGWERGLPSGTMWLLEKGKIRPVRVR